MRTVGIDLVILDIMMPGEDGLSLCRSIRENSGIPVIMLTARGEELDRIVGLEVGADDYVAKPFNPRELLARVERSPAPDQQPAAAAEGPRGGAVPVRRMDLQREPARDRRRRRPGDAAFDRASSSF